MVASARDFSHLWLAPKILSFGNVRINLTLHSLMRIFAKEEFRPTGGVPANRTATVSQALRTSSARHATAGRHTRRTARLAQTLLGLRQLPSRAGGLFQQPLLFPNKTIYCLFIQFP